jgi:hypothetical protein
MFISGQARGLKGDSCLSVESAERYGRTEGFAIGRRDGFSSDTPSVLFLVARLYFLHQEPEAVPFGRDGALGRRRGKL